MWGRRRARARRSKILPMVFKFEIGLKFARSDLGKPGFFRSGEMSASLNLEGKVPCLKDRFARCEMMMENSILPNYSRNVIPSEQMGP